MSSSRWNSWPRHVRIASIAPGVSTPSRAATAARWTASRDGSRRPMNPGPPAEPSAARTPAILPSWTCLVLLSTPVAEGRTSAGHDPRHQRPHRLLAPSTGDTGNRANSTPPVAPEREHRIGVEGSTIGRLKAISSRRPGTTSSTPSSAAARPVVHHPWTIACGEAEGLRGNRVQVDGVDVAGHPTEGPPGPLRHMDRHLHLPRPPRSRGAEQPTPRPHWPTGCGTGRWRWSASTGCHPR